MKLNKKSILALVLSLAMAMSLVPFAAFAEDGENAAPRGDIEITVDEDLTEEKIEELVEEIFEGTAPAEEEAEESAETAEAPEETAEEAAETIEEPAEEPAEDETAEQLEEAPAEEIVEEFDLESAKNELLNCTSEEDVNNYLETLGENAARLADFLTENEIRSLAAKLGITLEEEIVTPAADYTEVGPLMPPVTVTQPKKKMLMKAAPLPGTNALLPGASNNSDDGLELSKTAVANGNGTYTITLESYTTGTVTNTEKAVPTDIVLVLDESGSMADSMFSYSKVYSLNKSETYYVKRGDSYVAVKYCNERIWLGIIPVGKCSGWYTGSHFLIHWGSEYEPMTSASDSNSDHVQFYNRSETATSKRDALETAANTFVGSVYNDAVDGNVDHRVSVIGFSNDGQASTKIGLVDDIRSNWQGVSSAIGNLEASGGTYIEDGLAEAEKAFKEAPSTTAATRNRVVIIFTDGIPGNGSWNSTTIRNSANPAIATSNKLKNQYGATVYTIGLLDDADPELDISDEQNDSARTNKFLHYLSSNYPNAESMDKGGNGGNNGYYLSASDSASLTAIFEKIHQEIAAPTIELGSSAVVKDIVSPYFKVPADVSDIKVYTADYDGSKFGDRVESNLTPVITDDTITVSGFDFNKNFVSSEKHNGTNGKKLIIEFTVTPKDTFWGGNSVPTNGESSGVYDGSGNCVETFVQPTVDVPIKEPTISAVDKTIYYGQDAPKFTDLFKVNEGREGWDAAFVNIETVYAPNTVSDTADGTYKATVSVTPKTSGTYVKQEKDATAKVTVVYCTLTIDKSVTGLNTGNDENQSFIFHVFNDSTKCPVDMDVCVVGSDSVTIGRLPIGTYTVTEKSGWSWRYETADNGEIKLEPSSEGHAKTFGITNKRSNPFWLNGCSYAINSWTADGVERKKIQKGKEQ